jgi:hypothetical protein
MVCEQALQARLEFRFGSPFSEHIFSRLRRSSALKSVPGAPLRSTPGTVFEGQISIINRTLPFRGPIFDLSRMALS